jgi:hypothetical protein
MIGADVNLRNAVRWWPLIGLSAMVALGLVVGRGSTSIDDWFTDLGHAHHVLGRLLFFTDPRVLVGLLAVGVVVVLYQRRWRLAAVVVLTPPIAIAAARLAKRLFGRLHDGALAYPSGHSTAMVVVVGVVVMVVGVNAWTVVVATVYCLFGLVGQGVTYHYFTDTIGALLLGTALLCLAASMADLTGVNPRATHVTATVSMGP